ncbi:sulfurtransferase [Shewanella sp. NFH-SH190041]|nr:sulfurtransferase [Shewanella sp. NFH-SH190041]
MENTMPKLLKQFFLSLTLLLTASHCLAGAGGELTPAVVHDLNPKYISLLEGESLHKQGDVYFFDVNTLEIWAEGYIPGAVFFNVKHWRDLLPKNKAAQMVFYCANRLCTASVVAAREVMKLGYTNVMQMPDGIYGWRMSGRAHEVP